MEKSYIIEVITKDAPYISLGYVSDCDGKDVNLSREQGAAKFFTDKEELFAAAKVVEEWYKHGKVYAMAWFYEINPSGWPLTKRVFKNDIF